ncbi:phage terminase large subunit-like protein [Mycolicibacterium iranicum]|uniref:Phage terminase large subunit-like protein n=1 Tax=Mycolicibacterium iranicum TaxID=912594 RepID=A0A839Q9Y5_MYCIR|nr:terminase large subunit [Mycolicibacterium iranicum]MBB2992363.1 phage terminase large subunit-like protein [Mycolicibacterium iranicum]
MRAGPKGSVAVAPLSFVGWPRDRAKRREKFIRTFLKVPRGHGVGKAFRLRGFQREIVRGAFAPGVRTALVSIPRANGKTMLAAALALAELFVGPPSAEVLVVASDARQSAITLRYAKRMVELNPALAERVQVYADRLYVPENDATLLPLPAEPGALHGHDPSLLIVDELHVVTEAVWEAITSMSGKRPESLTLAISTPASSADSIMWRLVEHGRSGTDTSFYFREFAAPDGWEVDSREAWRIANPALSCDDPFLAEDGLASVLKTLREPVFRQLRLGQWVTGVDSWLPWGAWDACKNDHPIEGPITLGFDGSASGDSTALVGCTLDGHVFLIGLWENPGDPTWRVPREEVCNVVDLAFLQYDVLSMGCDPWGWRSEIEQWAKRYGETRVVEWNTGFLGRMAPATDRFYQAVIEHTLTHDGDPRLASHVAHCVARPTTQGDVIVKDKRGSPRKVDAAIAAIVAFDRRAFHVNKPVKKYRVASF